jgi:hypothetical protein
MSTPSRPRTAAEVYRAKIMAVLAHEPSAAGSGEYKEAEVKAAAQEQQSDNKDAWEDAYGRPMPQEWVEWMHDNLARGVRTEDVQAQLVAAGMRLV